MGQQEDSIRELILNEGWGRSRLMRQFPEVSEWTIKKIISEVKNKAPLTFKDVKPPVIRNAQVILDLKPVRIPKPKAVKYNKNKDYLETWVLFGDAHAPFQSDENVDLTCAIITELTKTRLDGVVAMGDMIDNYSVSRYDKSPLRRNQLSDELMVAGTMLAKLTDAAAGVRKVYLDGNHEKRLENYIAKNAPALASLPMLQIKNLLGLEEAGWQHEPDLMFLNMKLLLRHGSIVASASGATAKRELESSWVSGASGHVHRLGIHWRTSWTHTLNNLPPSFWIETGCLCIPDPDYMSGLQANWQPGIAIVRFDGKLMHPEVIPFHEGRAVLNGKTIQV